MAIPEKFRLLNIALVDVGAGTSDICITKEGTIVAYGMIPMAGDAVTDVIVQAHLVDFATAEEIKIAASMHRKVINYKDIMGIAAQTTPEEVFAETEEKVGEITELVAKKILELNGGKSVSAVFVVGGGGKLPDFVRMLAECLAAHHALFSIYKKFQCRPAFREQPVIREPHRKRRIDDG